MRYPFIRDNQHLYPIELLCKVLNVTRSGYYTWRDRPLSAAAKRRAHLIEAIREAHTNSRENYGSPRIYKELLARGIRCCENTVARLMKVLGIKAKMMRRRHRPRTTDSDHGESVAPNVLDRTFTASRPNHRWVADITYVATRKGWLCLATVMDLFSRKIVGYAMRDHLRTDLVLDAFHAALRQRDPDTGDELLHHSDRGSQYASRSYRGTLERHGITCSMSRRGECHDNAAMESFFGTLKQELVHHEDYPDQASARQSIFEYIEMFYNRQRRHSSLNYVSPDEYERIHAPQLVT